MEIVRMISLTSKGGIGSWKIKDVGKSIVGGDCRSGWLYAQVGLCKWRSTYHFVENSGHVVLKIELLFTTLSNFEREEALKDSAFQ